MAGSIVTSLVDLLGPGRIVVIGDVAGTRQFPLIAASAARRYSSTGRELIVGLEVPMTEPVETGQTGAFFDRQDSLLDGRSSREIAALISQLAAMPNIRTVALDGPWVAPGAPVPLEYLGLLDQNRDAVMAGRLMAEIDLNPHASVLALVGAEHARIDRHAQTFGGLLHPWFPTMVSLCGVHGGGTAWALSTAGPRVVQLDATGGEEPSLEWAREVGADGFHGILSVGRIDASPPRTARNRSLSPPE